MSQQRKLSLTSSSEGKPSVDSPQASPAATVWVSTGKRGRPKRREDSVAQDGSDIKAFSLPAKEEQNEVGLNEEDKLFRERKGSRGVVAKSPSLNVSELFIDWEEEEIPLTHPSAYKRLLVFVRAWLSFFGVVMVWAGLWGILDLYSGFSISMSRNIIYMTLGQLAMILTRTLAFNAGIELDPWIEVYRPIFRKEQLPTMQLCPPSCRVLGISVLALLAAALAAIGTVLYWIGCSATFSSIPGNKPGKDTASWLTASLQAVALLVLVLARALYGASNSRGGGGFQENEEAAIEFAPTTTSLGHMAHFLRKGKPDWAAWDEEVLEATRRNTEDVIWLYFIMYFRALVALPAVVLIWQTTTVVLLSWHTQSELEGLERELLYLVLGTLLIAVFRPAVFYGEAGLNEANAEEHVIALPSNEPSEAVAGRCRACWYQVVYEFRCLLALYGVMILWQGMEDLLSINDRRYIDFEEDFDHESEDDPFLIYLIVVMSIGCMLLLLLGSFFGAFGLPPASVILDHLGPDGTWLSHGETNAEEAVLEELEIPHAPVERKGMLPFLADWMFTFISSWGICSNRARFMRPGSKEAINVPTLSPNHGTSESSI